MNPRAFPEERIQEMVSRVAAYLQEERDRCLRQGEPLAAN